MCYIDDSRLSCRYVVCCVTDVTENLVVFVPKNSNKNSRNIRNVGSITSMYAAPSPRNRVYSVLCVLGLLKKEISVAKNFCVMKFLASHRERQQNSFSFPRTYSMLCSARFKWTHITNVLVSRIPMQERSKHYDLATNYTENFLQDFIT